MRKKKILIVEDDETLLKLECTFLASRGYEVKGVADGQAALKAVATMKPDLVLLDIMLSEIDGFEICQNIKVNQATRHIAVIMLTAKTSKEDMVKSEQVGADWYIAKPFKSAMLAETIHRFLS